MVISNSKKTLRIILLSIVFTFGFQNSALDNGPIVDSCDPLLLVSGISAGEVIGKKSPDPDIHPFNFRNHLLPIGHSVEVANSFESIKPGTAIQVLGEPQPLIVMNIRYSGSGTFLETLLFGRFMNIRRYYLAERIEVGGTRLTEVEVQNSPFRSRLLRADPEHVEFEIKQDQLEHPAMKLATSQMEVKLEGYHQGSTAFVNANVIMLSLLLEKLPLTMASIQKINFAITADGFDSDDLCRGVVRGSTMYTRRDDHVYRVDLSEYQVQGGEAAFTPASQVMARLNAWIMKANEIQHGSKMKEVIDLYREFLLIHPFADGNGRVARVLLDYLSIRAGFGPVPQQQASVRHILEYSEAYFLLKVLKAFREAH